MEYAKYITKYICQPLSVQGLGNLAKYPLTNWCTVIKQLMAIYREEKLLHHDGAFGAIGGMLLTSIESFADKCRITSAGMAAT